MKSGKVKDNFVDLEEVKRVPLLKILEMRGIQITNKLYFAIRNEKTPSCRYYKNNNSWYDFGSGEGGSVIDLLMKIDGLTAKEAIKELKSFI